MKNSDTSKAVDELIDYVTNYSFGAFSEHEWWRSHGRPTVRQILNELLSREPGWSEYRTIGRIITIYTDPRSARSANDIEISPDDRLFKGRMEFFFLAWSRIMANHLEVPIFEWQDILDEGWELAREYMGKDFIGFEEDQKYISFIKRFHERCNILGQTKYPGVGDGSGL